MKSTTLAVLAAFLQLQIEAAQHPSHGGPPSHGGTPSHGGPPNGDPYAPVEAECPATSLVRTANGISTAESNYVQARRGATVPALKAFARKSSCEFPELTDSEYPTVALTTSGGGFRSFLSGAGVHKAFDGRELVKYSTSGLYQAITYESGVSGGSWLVSSLSANDHPLISTLQTQLLHRTLNESTLVPNDPGSPAKYAQIKRDILAKQDAGFNVSTIDAYGRQVSYSILFGQEGGIQDTFSGVASTPSFKTYQAPFPLILALAANETTDKCDTVRSLQYEFSPFEFGSWDKGVHAFTQTKYLGSDLSNGKPAQGDKCVTGFDNLAIVHGASSNVLEAAVCPDSAIPASVLSPSLAVEQSLLPNDTKVSTSDQAFALYPNPFFAYPEADGVSSLKELKLVDGSTNGQVDPVWPFLYRPNVDVLIVNDNSGMMSMYPNGNGLVLAYAAAQRAGVADRLPVIPTAAVFNSSGLALKPTFFGCDGNKDQLTLIYLPDRDYSYPNVANDKVQFTPAETDGLIGNGVNIGTYNGTAGWDTCLSCVILKKATENAGKQLPAECEDCLRTHCYN